MRRLLFIQIRFFILCVATGLCQFAVASPVASSVSTLAEGSAEAVPDSLWRMLEEVDVVAVKQRSMLEGRALSGTVIGAVEIDRDNITDIKGASPMVPNFFIPDYGSRITSSIYVRGIGSRMDQPAVGLNVDNVGILNKDAYDFEMSDIVSIEMIRGPQSALFGRNTMTGLVSIRTLSPMTFQGWRGGASFSSGETFKLNAGYYARPLDNLGVSLSAGFDRSGGRFVNEYNGRKLDHELAGSWRMKIHWKPSAKVTLTNVLAGSLLRQGGYPYESLESGMISYNDTCFYRRFLINDGLTVRAQLGWAELLSVTSVQHIDDNMTLDQDFLPVPYFTLTQKKKETALTEDIMLRGKAGDKYSWLTGLYGFYRHLDMDAPVTFKETGISNLIVSHRNEANPYFPIVWGEDSFVLNSLFFMPSWGVALYHRSDLQLGRWHLSAGLRLDFERVNLKYHSYCNTSYTILRNPAGELPIPDNLEEERHVTVNLSESDRLHRQYLMLTPKVSALYDIDGSNNVYASIGRGYKAGGFNTQMFSDVLQQRLMGFMGIGEEYDVDDIVGYKPEQSWTFEAGSHLSFPKWRLTADLTLFYIHCRDQQLTVFPKGDTTGRLMTNAGRTRSAGGELSVSWRPVEALSLSCSYGYTDARFTDYDDGINDYSGKRLPYAPANTFYANATYMLRGAWLHDNCLSFSVGCDGAGDIYWNEQNSRLQNFYARLNASVSFEAPKWRVEVWGNNLTDTKYYTFYFKSMGNEFVQRALPATVGLSVSFAI